MKRVRDEERAGSGSVLLTCLGDNPASAVIAGRHFGVRMLVAITTARTQHLAPIIARQLEVPMLCVRHENDGQGYDRLAAAIQERLREVSFGALILDVTGGTKIMAIAALKAVESLRDSQADVVYLRPDGQLENAKAGALIPTDTSTTLREVLAWYGATVSQVAWEGELQALPVDYADRLGIATAAFHAVARKQTTPVEGRPNALRLRTGNWPSPLPPGFRLEGEKTLVSDVAGYFERHAWLEEFCLQRARLSVGQLARIDAAAGLKLTVGTRTSDLDEADGVLAHGPRVCVIEAKARLSSASAGADLQKRVQKTRRFFGALARVVFVHPAWGKAAPSDLMKSVGHNVWLVAGDQAHLDLSIREALGLTASRS